MSRALVGHLFPKKIALSSGSQWGVQRAEHRGVRIPKYMAEVEGQAAFELGAVARALPLLARVPLGGAPRGGKRVCVHRVQLDHIARTAISGLLEVRG